MTIDVQGGAPERISDGRRWFGLAVLSLAQLVIGIDLLIMLIALPSIQADLDMSVETGQWVITAYALGFGGLLLLGGRIADYNGRKRAFLVGLVGFTLASAAGGLAPNTAVLLAARALQGTFAALLVPAALSLVSVTFTEPKQRARALAVYGAVTGSGVALGMVFGGLITEYLDWRWCLLVNLPVCAVAFLAAVPTLLESKVAGHPRYDVLGATIGTLGITALVYGFARAGTDGWSDPITLAALGGAGVLTAAFVTVEAKVANPLLPLRLLASANRSAALLAILLIFAGVFGVFLFLTYYLQGIKGYSAIECGLALLPYAVAAVIVAGLFEQPLARAPRVVPIVLGLVGAAGVCVWFGFLDTDWNYLTHILPAMSILGASVVSTFVAVSAAVLDDAPDDDSGVCSALFNVAQQLAFALSPPLFTTIAVQATDSSADGPVPSPDDLIVGYNAGSFAAAGVVGLGIVLALAMMGFRRPPAHTAAPVPPVAAPVVAAPAFSAPATRSFTCDPVITEETSTSVRAVSTVTTSVHIGTNGAGPGLRSGTSTSRTVTTTTVTTTRTTTETFVTETVVVEDDPVPADLELSDLELS